MKRLPIPLILLFLCSRRQRARSPPAGALGRRGQGLRAARQGHAGRRASLRLAPLGPARDRRRSPRRARARARSWAAFKKTGDGNEAVTMGDLVLLGSEVDPVLGELQAGGFEILAIHNHLIGEIPASPLPALPRSWATPPPWRRP